MSHVNTELASWHAYMSTMNGDHSSDMSVLSKTRLGDRLKVAIVGAGISGLRCADLLTRAGAHVTIFEARDRIGGRCHQESLNNHLIDAGSNWIHGTEGNPIMDLARATDTIILEPSDDSITFDKTGRQFPKDVVQPLNDLMWQSIGASMEYSDQHCDEIDPKLDVYSWLSDRFTRNRTEHTADLLELCRRYGQFVGQSIQRQSQKFFWLEEGLPSSNVFVGSTYKKILAEIAKPAQSRAVIRLKSEVQHIQYRGDDGPVKLTLEDGVHECDEVVVTCPLGWLKRSRDKFTPALPDRLSRAIDTIGYGTLEKIYVSFESAWWLKSDPPTPWLIEMMNSNYHPDRRDSNEWNLSIISLAHIPSPANQPTLLFYMYGDCGATITKRLLGHEPGSNKYNALLNDFVSHWYTKIPGYQATPECQPKAFHLTMWQQDEFAGYGGYSCFPVGLEAGDKDIECMRDAGGLSDEGAGLWIAGEHTAPFVAMGTTTGAYWSGEGVAKRIAKRYGLALAQNGDP